MEILFHYDPKISETVFEMKGRGIKRVLTKTECRSIIKMLEGCLSIKDAYDIVEREVKVKEEYDRRISK